MGHKRRNKVSTQKGKRKYYDRHKENKHLTRKVGGKELEVTNNRAKRRKAEQHEVEQNRARARERGVVGRGGCLCVNDRER